MLISNLAIIPARGGSKRIPRKNIKIFLGKPIIAYSIEAALESHLFDEVMVSTDDNEIAEIAKQYGALVPFIRSNQNANDHATTMDVIQEVISSYQDNNRTFKNVCCIYPTAPLLTIQDLNKGYLMLTEGGFDTVLPVSAFSYPIWRSLKLENDKAMMNWPEHILSRSQDLPIAYHDAGQWYWLRTNNPLQSLFTENTGAVVIEEERVQDIDTESDWQLAEIKYERLQNS